MITDDDDVPEWMREVVERNTLAQRYDESDQDFKARVTRTLEAPCPSHGPDTRQRDGRCLRCGARML
jgi:hypothetical protein